MSHEQYPPISHGTTVMTLLPNHEVLSDWTDEGLESRRWGIRGTVVEHHDSHGLSYGVRHTDGTIGHYDPTELSVVKK